MQAAVKTMTVLRAAEAEGSFMVFTRAVRETGLDAVLSGPGPVTVFAPVDGAFDGLSEEERMALFKDAEKLRALVSYHIVPGALTISQVMALTSARTLGGYKLSIQACDGFTVNEAHVVKADITCSNGFIHGIDAVLIPGKG